MAGMLPLFIALALLPAKLVAATNFIVGDDAGWKDGVNYTQWAEGKHFNVGDVLVFRYNIDKYNVLLVNEDDFNACSVSTSIKHRIIDNDAITLLSSGSSWFICSRGNYCQSGMKLFIDVGEEVETPAPAPTGGEGNSGHMNAYHYSVAILVAALAMVVLH